MIKCRFLKNNWRDVIFNALFFWTLLRNILKCVHFLTLFFSKRGKDYNFHYRGLFSQFLEKKCIFIFDQSCDLSIMSFSDMDMKLISSFVAKVVQFQKKLLKYNSKDIFGLKCIQLFKGWGLYSSWITVPNLNYFGAVSKNP